MKDFMFVGTLITIDVEKTIATDLVIEIVSS